MPKLFISYRSKDSAAQSQGIRDKLAEQYGADSVVFDVDSIPPGVDFVDYLNQQVGVCDVLLTIIGDHWLTPEDGSRRIDDPNDYVRIEIKAALERDIPVIPVLVGVETRMPAAGQLPEDIGRTA